MDVRAEKLAKARKKLRDHQEKKVTSSQKEEIEVQQPTETLYDNLSMITVNKMDQDQNNITNGSQANFLNNQDTAITIKNSEMKSDVITEMLISNKTNLESQINDLSAKLAHMESLYGQETNNHNNCKQQNIALQSEINNLMTKYSIIVQEASSKDKEMQQLKVTNQYLQDERNNLFEQVELTKSMLATKESENTKLLSQVSTYQNQIELLQLQIQQLTNDSTVKLDQNNKTPEETEALLHKISSLEQKIETLQKDKEQINSHYEHYVRDLNERLKSEINKNETLSKDLQNLYNRENSLIEQISEMEIRLQNYATKKSDLSKQEQIDTDLQNKYIATKNELEEINVKYNELQKQHMDCQKKISELTQASEIETQSNIYKHDNVDISKLNADIASDKLAAQRATEQNKKLKSDVEALEQVIVKMGKDKLELTEKWTHEKQLNKGLSLKLAELEECAKNMQNQLKAKDDEMIRLLNEYREMERKHDMIIKDVNDMKQNSDVDINQQESVNTEKSHSDDTAHEHTLLLRKNSQDVNTTVTDGKVKVDNICIKKEDAMVKLQERFLNIMDEVANLSDEKHRLEHIILQLQNETDTICEYVALYQQQRSLLKRREEERSKQLKIYQEECDKLKHHLEELRDLLLRFAADEELASFLKEESRYNDLTRVKELLEKLQNCSLITSKFNNLDLNIFYPCNCCSGQLIDI
ncbi:unnamed protein product [Euphydryas editha]|uniref:Golgin subfamily A conserved domain-containing protein n=1 Tax=Euphydryas editha TaxID=104508 RepID=A0AAU9V3F3_EUPED|nr:unnamed protein product [Euphydryas editha]